MEIIIFIAIVVGIIVWKKKRKETTNNTGIEETTEVEDTENIDGQEETQKENQEIKEDVVEESKDEPTDTEKTTNEPFPVYWYEDGVKKEGTAIMSKQGLQVFDGNGNCTLDITERLQKILGTIEITTASGEITDERLENGDLWFFFISSEDITFGDSFESLSYPTISKDGSKLTWNFNGNVLKCKLLYGVF